MKALSHSGKENMNGIFIVIIIWSSNKKNDIIKFSIYILNKEKVFFYYYFFLLKKFSIINKNNCLLYSEKFLYDEFIKIRIHINNTELAINEYSKNSFYNIAYNARNYY